MTDTDTDKFPLYPGLHLRMNRYIMVLIECNSKNRWQCYWTDTKSGNCGKTLSHLYNPDDIYTHMRPITS